MRTYMLKKSKYPIRDSRRIFEYKGLSIEWNAVYEMVSKLASLTKKFLAQNPDNETYQFIRTRGLRSLIRYTMDYCGEKHGYYISKNALLEFEKSGKIIWGSKMAYYMEHLIPVDQCANDILKNPDIDNVKSLYDEQRIVIMLRKEKNDYEGKDSPFGKDFKKYRTEKEIEQFINRYKISKFKEVGLT